MMLSPALGFAQSRPAKRTAPPKSTAKVPKPPPTEVSRSRIASLRVEGNRHYNEARVLAVAGIKPGAVAGKEEFEAAYNRLLATGLFETVSYRFEVDPKNGSYNGVFQVVEVEPVLPLRFERLGVTDQELRDLLSSKDPLFLGSQVAANKPVIDRYRDWISAYLKSKGLDDKIAGAVGGSSDGPVIVFQPTKLLPAVSQVAFEGNSAISLDDLRAGVAVAAIGAPYTEERFREILDASVRPLYEAKGRVRVSFPEIRTEPVPDASGLSVTVRVEEGDVYNAGKIAFADPAPPEASDLMRTAGFKPGQLNLNQVNESLEKIRQALRRMGYLDAKVAATRDIHDPEKTVDLSLHADPGARYAMGSLKVTGLDLNGEAEIRRIWTLKQGAPFNPEYPDAFLSSVRAQGLFDNLGGSKQETSLDESAHTANVNLIFQGAGPKPEDEKKRGPFTR